MSVKHALLALLEDGPRHGYQLRAEFQQRTGGTWPLNVGQVYTTLARLERDGLVASSEPDESGHVHYRVTASGRREVAAWFTAPVCRRQRPRDEFAIKLALAVTTPGVDVSALVDQQRAATTAVLAECQALAQQERAQHPDDADDLARSLLLDAGAFEAEAELRWLDHCESRLRRAAIGLAVCRETTANTADLRGVV